MKNLLNIILNASPYYACLRFFIWLILINNETLQSLNYHPSKSLEWNLIWFGYPVLISLIISFFFKIKLITKIGIFFLPLLLISTVIFVDFNKKHWGYYFRRPDVFSELKSSKSITSITSFNKSYKKNEFSIKTGDFSICKPDEEYNFYYNNFNRSILTFKESIYSCHRIKSIERSLNTKVAKEKLNNIMINVLSDELIINKVHQYYYNSANRITGKLIEFKTNKKKFIFVALSSGEVQNDHYPFYEFLIEDKTPYKVLKKQRFFVDIAGIEGFEYSDIAAFFDFLLLASIYLVLLIVKILSKINKKLNKHFISNPKS